MWDRETNSDEELDLVYKGTDARGLGTQKQKDHQYLPEPTCTPVDSGNTETATTTANLGEPGKATRQSTTGSP